MSRLPLFLLLFLIAVPGSLGLDVPKLQARVTDLAGLLSEDQVRALEGKLAELEKTDSTQVALLVIPSLEDEPLEDYTLRVAEAWGLGGKGKDNGALVLIAMKERKVRIEVGYGLESKLTDAYTRRIIQQELAPNFRHGDYYKGIDAAISAIIHTVRGEYQAPAHSPVTRSPRGRHSLEWLIFLFVPVLFVLGSAGLWGGALVGGGAGTFLLYMLTGSLMASLFAGGIPGLILGAFLARAAGASGKSPRRSRWGRHGVGPFLFPGGGSGIGFGGGGGFSGGGFSGGGGGFGGGGSSGSW